MRKGWAIAAGAVMASFGLAYLASPYLAVRHFVLTARQGRPIAWPPQSIFRLCAPVSNRNCPQRSRREWSAIRECGEIRWPAWG